MELHPLTAISPIDGRYHHQLQSLGEYFSEYALIKYRLAGGSGLFYFSF